MLRKKLRTPSPLRCALIRHFPGMSFVVCQISTCENFFFSYVNSVCVGLSLEFKRGRNMLIMGETGICSSFIPLGGGGGGGACSANFVPSQHFSESARDLHHSSKHSKSSQTEST